MLYTVRPNCICQQVTKKSSKPDRKAAFLLSSYA